MRQFIRVHGLVPRVPTCLKSCGRSFRIPLLIVLLLVWAASPLWARTFVTYDFTTGLAGWTTNANMANVKTTAEGMAFDSLGTDPYCWGPAENFPVGQPLMVTIRMKSLADESGEMFYGTQFVAGQSKAFGITADGQFHDYTINLPAQPAGARLRLDPAGATPGHIVIASIKVNYFPRSEVVANWDFRQGWQGWAPNFDTANAKITADGAEFDTLNNDPWFEGPAADYPNDQGEMVTIRMRSTADTAGALYYGQAFSEAGVKTFSISNDGQWHDYQLILPPLGLGARLRLDPAGSAGHVTVQLISVQTLVPVVAPATATPVRPTGSQPKTISSGPLTVVHYGQRWGGFVVQVGGMEFASSHDDGRVAVLVGENINWIDLKTATFTLTAQADQMVEQAQVSDGQGGTITLRRTIKPGTLAGALTVAVNVTATRAEEFYHIPWLTLLPGLGTFGTQKKQAVFSGLEYLANEPSSSAADIASTVPEHVRRVPPAYKITLPLMAIDYQEKYLGVVWDQTDLTAAVFDTPDRVFNSGAQLMALWAPTVSATHLENDLYPQEPFSLAAGGSLAASATLIGGAGESIVPAIQQYVALRGLPKLPDAPGGAQGVFSLLAGGWLDSALTDKNGHWQHAVWSLTAPSYQIAADAPVFMRWLAWHTTDTTLAGRLRTEAAKGQQNALTGGDRGGFSRVGHVSHSDPALIYSDYVNYLTGKLADPADHFALFDPITGIRKYVQESGKPDFSKTHFANHANGEAATDLYFILEDASLTGDEATISRAIGLLDKQTALYANSEPRGAQTWEVPLHTPDILASAYLVRAYVMGYKMTGRQDLLDQAIYWAWTGVPFVYLTAPTPGPVGVYSTIAVFGGTHWVAPVWIGLPVQWCGLVYGAALHELAPYDPTGPWARIAQGITITGLQMSHPASDTARQGLLPDSYNLPAQARNPVPINPGTVSATLPQVFGLGRMYEFRALPGNHWFLNAPCAINNWSVNSAQVKLTLDGFGPEAYRLLATRVAKIPARVLVRPSGSAGAWNDAKFNYDAAHRWLIVDKLTGPLEVSIQTGQTAAGEGWMEWMR